MAKHDRRKTSGQPPSSRPVTIQVPLPVLGVVNGVREAFHGLCIGDRAAGPGGDPARANLRDALGSLFDRVMLTKVPHASIVRAWISGTTIQP